MIMETTTLKNPIELSKEVFESMQKQKKSLGYAINLGWMIVIEDLTIEEKKVTNKKWGFLSRKKTTETIYLLTEARIRVWNVNRLTWSYLSEQGINILLNNDDVSRLRIQYLMRIKNPLQSLGVQFKPKLTNE